MSMIKWDLVFINNNIEFFTYLSTSDFKEVSLISKLLRLKYKPKLFERILISSNIDKCIIEEYAKLNIFNSFPRIKIEKLPVVGYITYFSICMQRFQPYVKSVRFGLFASHCQTLEVSILFPQLSSLFITNFTIELSIFQKVLNNLQSLKRLSISLMDFLHVNTDLSNLKPIKLPNTLKYIDWQNCKVSLCTLNEGPQTMYYSCVRTGLYRNMFRFEPENFPNLKYFSCHLISESPINIEIFKLNPQLTHLKLKIEEFNQDTSLMLNLVHSIKKMELTIDNLNFNLTMINLNLPNLTCLHFYGVSTVIWPIIEKLSHSSPRLAELLIHFASDGNYQIIELINNLSNLQRLTVKSYYRLNLNFDEFKPSSKFKYFDLYTELDILPVLKSLDKHPIFKLARFNKWCFDNAYLLIKDQENTPKPWKLVDGVNFVKFYK
ncbi:hypothetical protein CONCODRAFT_70479 [Conidiobolus coronatus NRRL 28638]|uniref:F-box domain-containing protein n=1 Tax=Conidiobolus coronatus (strain ATCC 28846 / CBS 209.66 / NRRL 28638) TaxID=796925 RepID=A0A137P6P4_CONC2|nr:hypothetical protein CONCODRAFT_70479 [Conidiobolus coronatus NRRL 28638]|eukprot:KXN70683.1 hypothetical protein CONCODRAFT_70479 [Conidiobolus coronatus NRRL 28638]